MGKNQRTSQEFKRLSEANAGIREWRKWGPYLSERQWGTVREDYSTDGNAWGYLTHDLARSKAFRWGEEGIAGISEENQLLCFSLGLWNHQDSILKERLYGLTGHEGNHGEDVKEYYYYLDNTPSHSYMKMLYKYPQKAFPYGELVGENTSRGRLEPEFELIDTGIFDSNEYFDVFVEYAKASEEDILIRILVHNRGPEDAPLCVLPTLWFRNTWEWGGDEYKPKLESFHPGVIDIQHRALPKLSLYCKEGPDLLFCENETNRTRLYQEPVAKGFYKDGINDFLVNGNPDAVFIKPDGGQAIGTKASAFYNLVVPAGGHKSIRLRLGPSGRLDPFSGFDYTMDTRLQEANEFYQELQEGINDPDLRNIQRQAYAGMLWTKQFYYYDVPKWLSGDTTYPEPPPVRHHGRNHEWMHLHNSDIISMPDKWEYPWYAAWDLAFHCIPLAELDAEFAKEQLVLFITDAYMHPNGQLPAYEWNFSDVNPPVHAWATWRVYQIDKEQNGGKGDRGFLERIFHKLLLNFTWWVNRKDREGKNVFQGGFLGLDNIGVFDRSAQLPTGGYIEQADGTSWMAMYSLNLLRISLELAKENPIYQHMAAKFFEHFLYIAGAMANIADEGINIWDDEDNFFYDVLNLPSGEKIQLKVRSMVGLTPLFAVEVLQENLLKDMPEFTAHMEWVLENRPELANLVSRWKVPGKGDMHLLALVRRHRMKKLLTRMLDETEFLSDHGIRALSRYHLEHPYVFHANDNDFVVQYLPAESDSDFFGGNSNWRGPVWFPMNYLLIESLYKFHKYYGDEFQIEYPTGSKKHHSLREIADELVQRLIRLFSKDEEGRRPVYGTSEKFQEDPHFRDYILFYEYFHGDNGRGVGASHQTGWTGLVANLLYSQPKEEETEPSPTSLLL
ncbi:MAG: glucosidase [Bacteroidota bacterium]